MAATSASFGVGVAVEGSVVVVVVGVVVGVVAVSVVPVVVVVVVVVSVVSVVVVVEVVAVDVEFWVAVSSAKAKVELSSNVDDKMAIPSTLFIT